MADLWREIRDAVNDGYRLAADVLGAPCRHFRPLSGVAALDASCVLGILPASFDANDYRYSRAMPSGKAMWSGLWDASQTQVGDYLVDDSTATTWFIASQDPLLPMQAVRCNAVVTLSVQVPTLEAGASSSYSGSRRARETNTALSYACSLLMGPGGAPSDTRLPSEPATDEGVIILLPMLPGVTIATGQFLTDGHGVRFFVEAVEDTAKGWRIRASRKGP